MNLLLTGIALALLFCGAAETTLAAPDSPEIVCTRHLMTICHALKTYQRGHGELPPHLSDLYPRYLADKADLHCPNDASPGRSGFEANGIADPKLPNSYVYQMTTDPRPFGTWWLGPGRDGEKQSFRADRMLQRANFGERVPVVSCYHHGFVLHLTLTGYVYRGSDVWEKDPATIPVMLECMDRDLSAGTSAFRRHWEPRKVEEYAGDWIDAPLSPVALSRLKSVAGRLTAVAKALPTPIQPEAHRLAARFYGAAGQLDKAVAAADTALRLRREDQRARWLLADLRYRASSKRTDPPVDAWLRSEMDRLHIPGASLAVMREGQLMHAVGFGLAEVEKSIPATKDTVYPIASCTKSMTSATIMMLAQEGKLSLDGKITTYLPDLPAAWGDITVWQVVTHTAGIPNFGVDEPENTTPAEHIRKVARLPLDFPPGERSSYSNTGYALLSVLIEKVCGKPFGEVLAERFFQPLRMTTSGIDEPGVVTQQRARGYVWEGGTFRRSIDRVPSCYLGAGGVVSSAPDLVRWFNDILYTDRFMKGSNRPLIQAPIKLKNGGVIPTHLGFRSSLLLGTGVDSHGRAYRAGDGGGRGIPSSSVATYPANKVTVVLLANRDVWVLPALDSLTQRIAAAYVAPPEPIEGGDPKVTQMLKQVLIDFKRGQINPTRIATESLTLSTEARREAAGKFYRSLGLLQSFQLISREDRDEERIYRYRAVFGKTRWIQTFVLTPEGKIAELTAEPE
jgi:D-alanyl-D-alanine carboxypeptidase